MSTGFTARLCSLQSSHLSSSSRLLPTVRLLQIQLSAAILKTRRPLWPEHPPSRQLPTCVDRLFYYDYPLLLLRTVIAIVTDSHCRCDDCHDDYNYRCYDIDYHCYYYDCRCYFMIIINCLWFIVTFMFHCYFRHHHWFYYDYHWYFRDFWLSSSRINGIYYRCRSHTVACIDAVATR